ncbi:MAG: DinB family protein [Acidobacteria bacterium]|nr:DinB family protein [Acidobacteriota bacterium]
MSKIQGLLQELEQEARTTRRVLERVPEDRLTWKPHEKSMTLGQLALHVANIPGGLASAAIRSPFQVPGFNQPSPASSAELVPALEQSVAKAREILSAMDESALGNTWRVVDGDKELMAIPVGAMLRSLMLNHWYHHRGQLSVYLREVGVPVPSIYGPSADENPFVAQPAAASV